MGLPRPSRLLACLFITFWAPLIAPALAQSYSSRETPIVRAVRRAKPAVVNISSEKRVHQKGSLYRNSNAQRVSGMGSGVIVDERGFILTNAHVVHRVTSLVVTLEDGRTYQADPLRRDPATDLALIKIRANRPLPTIPMGTSSDLMVGETVIAVGNAYGYENTVTRGVISAIGRTVRLNEDLTYHNLIQTDAGINPGNSGGALLNIDGELIGVNVAIRAGAQGISFAIPVDTVRAVAAQLMRMTASDLSRTWHGVKYRESVDLTSRLGIVTVERVDGPGRKAGIQPDDRIIRVDDREIHSALDFERSLLDKRPGDQAEVVVRRGQLHRTMTLTIEQLPMTTTRVWRHFGMQLAQIEPSQVQRFQPQLRGGMFVVNVRPRGPAALAGVAQGDVLLGLGQWETLNYENVLFVLTQLRRQNYEPLRAHILRQGKLHEFTIRHRSD